METNQELTEKLERLVSRLCEIDGRTKEQVLDDLRIERVMFGVVPQNEGQTS